MRLLDFGLAPVRRGRHAHGRRRRAGHARVHLARAARRRGGDRGDRRLGGRRPALGGARRPRTRSGRRRCSDDRGDPGRRAAAPPGAARPAASGSLAVVDARSTSTRPSVRLRPGWPRTSETRSATAAGRVRPRLRVKRPARHHGRRRRPSPPSASSARSRSQARRWPQSPQSGAAALLPFYPPGLVVGLGLAAGAASLVAPRAGLALALAAPVFPLGNVSLGLALALRRRRAARWLAPAGATPARAAFAVGPLLAPLGLIGLVPLAVAAHSRRAATGPRTAASAVLAAALVAGTRGARRSRSAQRRRRPRPHRRRERRRDRAGAGPTVLDRHRRSLVGRSLSPPPPSPCRTRAPRPVGRSPASARPARRPAPRRARRRRTAPGRGGVRLCAPLRSPLGAGRLTRAAGR